ncbi:probable glycosyltransferase At3g07620 [Lotus japonicus]|uniref:probable glycosyltransferase At3g07620 n=1 Tax=Lotus japonicus TaxID=34305 RepID=UPI0025900C25|nr:probable glycosyltransferase At3g07620 [Lotus japonicus]
MYQSLYAFILLLSVMVAAQQHNPSPNPYLTTTTILNRNYQKMVKTFKVFMYEPNQTQLFKFRTEPESLFYSSLHNSTYLTKNAEEAHMFFLPFSHHTSTRSLARIITRIRNDFPYWNRTLGADHFYLSRAGIPREADRNLVELKKNAVQISCFPTPRVRFVPHKDITLPPFLDPHALVISGGAFCVYGKGNVSWVGEALRSGCVPVVVAEGPVNDMPFMDVLRWGEMAVFVESEEAVKRVLNESDAWRERYARMRRLGVVASRHLLWNHTPLPLDAFNTIMYQLWLRRHTIRYRSTQ